LPGIGGANITPMTIPESSIPAPPSTALVEEALEVVAGDWLTHELSVQSAHWRIENELPLLAADRSLRALFLLAYREFSKPQPSPESRAGPNEIYVSIADISDLPSLRQSTDDTYGKGFYAAVMAYSRVLVDRSPTSRPTELLSGLSDFLRAGPARLERRHCGPATRVLENIWEKMNVGWIN